ncbi:hypothetical protein [Caulobacter sp. S45]|uniref:hypothetical protein n=1 Tax=Caulobacter sp. S45 TaxID=1641861 RepID=UPI001576D4EC|nr:hypothetical protein [Caulobacter sp. S45]
MDPMELAGGLSAVGSLFSGATGFFDGQRALQVAKQNYRMELNQSGVAAQEAIGQGDRVEAKAATEAAANGGGLVGSSMGVIQDLSNQSMFNARSVIYRGQTQAAADLYQGEVAKVQGERAAITGAVNADSSLMGGWAKSAQTAQINASLRGGDSYYRQNSDANYGYGG